MNACREEIENFKKVLATPKDLKGATPEAKAAVLVLYAIGYVAKPTGLTEEEFKVAREAFINCHAGKIEKEEEAICEALKKLPA